jgi:serine protease Do
MDIKANMKTLLQKTLATGVLALVGGTAIYLANNYAFGDSPKAQTKAPVHVTVNEAPLSRDTRATASFSPVVKRSAPSVVNIFTTKKVKNQMAEMNPFFNDPRFRQFFGTPDLESQGNRSPRMLKQTSLGSGVVVTEDGYILTNNHVVDGADEVMVMLEKDRKEYIAKIVGRDPKTDLAVLKIEARSLPYATFADSDKTEVGDVVLAIGNPFGIGQTVTSGIISAKGRGGMGIEAYEDFLQTDAAINPGNSGGALIDAEGRVVGINTAILSRTGGNHGVGFAVPSNLVRLVMDQLIKDGHVVRGFLGVAIQDVNADLAKQFNLPEPKGALVGEVNSGSAAANANMKDGDIIIEFDGKQVPDSRNLRLMVANTAPGKKVDVKVMRDGKEKTLHVTLKALPENELAASGKTNSAENTDALQGVAVSDLNPMLRRQFNLPSAVHGAIITEVDPNSAAYEAGIRPGMVLQEINRKPVASAEDAVKFSKNVKDKQVLVRLWANGGSRYLVVDESKAG